MEIQFEGMYICSFVACLRNNGIFICIRSKGIARLKNILVRNMLTSNALFHRWL